MQLRARIDSWHCPISVLLITSNLELSATAVSIGIRQGNKLENKLGRSEKNMSRPRFELRTACVLDRSDNQLHHRPMHFMRLLTGIYSHQPSAISDNKLGSRLRAHPPSPPLRSTLRTLATHQPFLLTAEYTYRPNQA